MSTNLSNVGPGPGPASSVGVHLLLDPAIWVHFSAKSRILTNWWEFFCACGNQNAQNDFSKSFILYVYELINHTIYWIKNKVDFVLYTLSERECSPNKLDL